MIGYIISAVGECHSEEFQLSDYCSVEANERQSLHFKRTSAGQNIFISRGEEVVG